MVRDRGVGVLEVISEAGRFACAESESQRKGLVLWLVVRLSALINFWKSSVMIIC